MKSTVHHVVVGSSNANIVGSRYLDHAALLCKSRAFSLMAQEDGDTAGGSAADSAGRARERRLLVPVLDLINHSAEPGRVCSAI